MKKKTVYVWIILILSAIGIVFGLLSFINSLIHIKTLVMPAFLSSPIMNIGSFVLQTTGTVLLFIFFIKLYNLSQNLVKWTNIIFGYLFFRLFSSIFIIMGLFKIPMILLLKSLEFMNPIIIILFIAIILIIGIIWFTFVRHLKKNKERLFGDFELENKIERPVKKFQFNKLKFLKITTIILTVIIIIFITFLVSKKISGTDVIESRLMMIQNEILSYKATLNGLDSQILYSVVCNDNFLLDRKMEILDITSGKFKCFNNNTDYVITAKMKDKFGYFCIDSKQNIGGVKINMRKYNFINEDNIYCPTTASLKENDQSVINNNNINEQGKIIKKFVKGKFKVIDTGEIFEYTEEYKPNDIGYLRDYNANAVNDCINTNCSSIYFIEAPYSTQSKIAIYNTNDDFRDGVVENVEFYSKNEKVLSYSELKSIDDRIVYTIKSKINDYYSSYPSNEYPCLEISSGVIKCRQPIFNIGDKIVTFGSKDDGSYLRGEFLLNKITNAQLISYQYFMVPDTGEVFPVIQKIN
jgi:hypothetical protein